MLTQRGTRTSGSNGSLLASPNSMFFSGEYQEPYQGGPLFERMGQDELAELREFKHVIQQQESRIAQLEDINVDLERRLEQQAKERMEMDRELAEQERAWHERIRAAEADRDEWKTRLEEEKKHSGILREKLRRTEKEMYSILQRKYEIVQAAKAEERNDIRGRQRVQRDLRMQAGQGGSANGSSTTLSGGGGGRYGSTFGSQGNTRGSSINFNPLGAGPVAVREKRVVESLCDFFGC